ncbi:DUF2065 domain-containing protein [Marinicella sp. W31]|uniref:DUF2065 domain-containing protein n=1 Tax=Marinicella sp. W31 TaxID=3023713 RepID=UPI003756485B
MLEHPILTGLALVLIMEGLMPFLAPAKWRLFLQELAKMSDQQLRIMGGVMLISGALLFQWVKA